MTIEPYKQFVQTLLEQHAQGKPASGETEVELICDTQRDRDQIVVCCELGWKKA